MSKRTLDMRFRLRSLFWIMACCSLVICIFVFASQEYRRRQAVRQHLTSLGASWVGFKSTKSACETSVVFGNPISNELDDFTEFENIEFKGFDVDADCLERLTVLERVASVRFISCHLKQGDVEPLTRSQSITELIFWNVNVSDESIVTILTIPGLRRVCFKNTDVTPGGIEVLKKANPDLEVVWQP